MKHIKTFEGFLNESQKTFNEGLNESLDVQKNAKKLKIFGVLPKKIIHAEESNSYMDSGTSITDKSVPDFNRLDYSYTMQLQPSGNKVSFRKGGGITYSTLYGANKIISYQSPQMERQRWYVNLIFATAEEAQTAWNYFLYYYKLEK